MPLDFTFALALFHLLTPETGDEQQSISICKLQSLIYITEIWLSF